MEPTAKPPRRRIRTDPCFYTILAVIGGTYVLLIVAMLAADAMYIFTSEMTKPVTIDFSTYGDGESFQTGDVVQNQFSKYGLSISTGDDDHPAVILDSGRPSAANSELGTPHADFGGPGIGAGGMAGSLSSASPGANDVPLGHVIVIPLERPPFADTSGSEAVMNWVSPVRVDRFSATGLPVVGKLKSVDTTTNEIALSLTLNETVADKTYSLANNVSVRINSKTAGLDDLSAGSLVALAFDTSSNKVSTISAGDTDDDLYARIVMFDAKGVELAQQQITGVDDGRLHQVELAQADVSRIVMSLPASARDVDVSFTASRETRADLSSARRETLKQGHVHVVQKGIKRVTPRPDGGKIIFQWQDPIRLDGVRLLNIDRPNGSITTFDVDGQELSKKPLADRGENSVQSIEYHKLNSATGLPIAGAEGVARVEVDLPCGGAVAEIEFAWTGRVRGAWERESPGLARWFYNPITAALAKPDIRYSIKLSLISCTISAILSLWVAIPIGYLLSRYQFFGRNLLDAILDIPIVLPPLVVGISLLILFQYMPPWIRERVVYQVPAVILAQFAVACAFAVRTMRATFDQIDARREQVALTLGCSRAQAFGMVVLPEAWRGILTAGTLAWARSLGEFGPLLIFAGATRNKTEVLSTTVFLELSIGDLGAAVAVSLIMVVAAVIVLVVARLWGTRNLSI